MPHRSGLSHGLAAFLMTILAALLIDYIKPVFPLIHRVLTDLGVLLAHEINGILGTNINPKLFTVAFVTFFLAFLWGVFYHFARKHS